MTYNCSCDSGIHAGPVLVVLGRDTPPPEVSSDSGGESNTASFHNCD